MPKAKPTKLTGRAKLLQALNSKLDAPRSVSSICTEVGQTFKIVGVGAIQSGLYKKDSKILPVSVENLAENTEHSVYFSSKYLDLLKSALADPEAKKKDWKYADIVGGCFEVIEIRDYKDMSFPELRFYEPEKKTVTKKKAPPVRQLVDPATDDEDDMCDPSGDEF